MEKFKQIFEELKVKILDGIKEAGKVFIVTLWDFLKEDVIEGIKESLELLKELVKSEAGQQKKEFILDIIMEKIKLPLFLKPFKGLIRRALSKKIEETVETVINKGFEFVA